MAYLASDAYAKVDESIHLRGKRLRSRVYLPAHQPGLAEDGLPGDRYIEYHRRRARAGLGMQITGATPVLWSEVWAGGLTPAGRHVLVRDEMGHLAALLGHSCPTSD